MENSFNNNPHRRLNILTGEWILVSPHRTKRPWQGKTEKSARTDLPAYDTSCYLCPTNERMGGGFNPNYEKPYSFVNDFSALLPNVKEETYKNGLLYAESESGICKVVCFSPDHSLTLPLMSVPDITDVISLWQKEYKELGAREGIEYVQIFENKGAIMGCSNPHPHGQIWAQHNIPQEVHKKSGNLLAYWKKHGRSILEDYMVQELELQERNILENEHFVALIPYWAIWPYETMIIPKRKLAHIGLLSEPEKVSYAEILKQLTIKYDNIFNTSFPYSAGIHQAPTDGRDHPEWHFHMSFYPPLLRSATVKKFMVGYEMFANPQRDITAEQAAETMKTLPNWHYSGSGEE
ncbi:MULTISPECIES: UDP-glucose--hexose-1-phosphate uridylyltransferase [unclassified Arenibacter]|jgi:UDPglucose--hexose-1-phosphate uridylyltransferase|uniref:UDP-glucose--hexose-1-phosphate uridylyltransferase n=1 Tax=unclassified Arenibacter TaxID=2615047 RepID=UPI000E34E4EE|nr:MULTISPECIES: UDP-glucose--hexose-1-phosphate uridylyltransferase [unclassified Arenibacter]MCM4163372.1 galactose-1-phosphate uridylyltransferase [Arenibacter sp. A80]RFT57375.1 UDP-glucose--hexose-1-phosphate uridylyltransferase [Arenibacter sp. P308M17]